jgi:drug efflux transport system ATP-binding protein
MSDAAPIIRAEGLTRKFGDFTAVDRLTIRVVPGSLFAFLGANGSGKSTTIRMLIGLLTPTSGTIEVDGVDVIRHPRRVRDHIGYMGQKVSLYQGLTLRENVEFYGGLYGLAPKELEDRWSALAERLSLREAESSEPGDLPAGVRQRAGLALSTLHRPRVLFLDEPTAGVDVHNRALFWELIQDEARAGVTVFVTTHFLEEADYCDWVCFIEAGRLVADASPEDLRRRYSQGYRVRVALANGDAGAAHDAGLQRALAELARGLEAGGLAVAASPTRIEVKADALDGRWLHRIAQAQVGHPGLRVSVEQPQMTDIFRAIAQAEKP